MILIGNTQHKGSEKGLKLYSWLSIEWHTCIISQMDGKLLYTDHRPPEHYSLNTATLAVKNSNNYIPKCTRMINVVINYKL